MRRAAFAFIYLATTTLAFAAGDDDDAGQFLDRSVVVIPRSTGDYALAETHYDPVQWMYGVTSKWVVNAAPGDLRLSVFVYPIGRTTEKRAAEQAMDHVVRELQAAVAQNIYSELVLGEREAFDVVAAPSSLLEKGARKRGERDDAFDPKPRPEIEAVATERDDPLAAAVAAAAPSPNTHGLRQSFRFTHDGVPMRSLGYVFYRHLFAFKVRATTPLDSMDDTLFSALIDTATRNLVPRIDVRNYGQCGTIQVSEPPKGRRKQKASDAMAQQLILGIARVRADNCATDDGDEPDAAPDGGVQFEIVYPPDTWKAGD